MAKLAPQSPNTSPRKTSSDQEPVAVVDTPAVGVTKRRVAARIVRTVGIWILTVFVLIIGLGVGYTWYMGQQPALSSNVNVPEVQPAAVIKPVTPAANAGVGASVQSLTSPVTPGSNANIIIRTRQYADCTIVVEYDKVASADSGLTPKKADDFGIVSWTWTVEPATPIGKWPVRVTCSFNDKSAVVQGELVVQLTTQE